MTAEVVVMNRQAVALAADSAVTLGREHERKTFTSASKIFTLSKYRPVAIMLFGSASLMGVPWETVIKMYRRDVGRAAFGTLEEYSAHFLRWLKSSASLFPPSEQTRHVSETVRTFLGREILSDIQEEVEVVVGEKGRITEAHIGRIAKRVIARHYEKWESFVLLPCVPENHASDVLSVYRDAIDGMIAEVMRAFQLRGKAMKQLTLICASLFAKDFWGPQTSGVVIAGFGEDEPFPSVRVWDIEGMANNCMKYREHTAAVDFDSSAYIAPFAERAMVYTFMEGIDPTLSQLMQAGLRGILEDFPEMVVESLSSLDEGAKQATLEQLGTATERLLEEYEQAVADYRRRFYAGPVLDVVDMLPKAELAAMAESLVSLTLVKRRVTWEYNTVAPPIDVAVVSKGDGFVWIQRKRYFDADLNPQFFANYYREPDDEEEEQPSKETSVQVDGGVPAGLHPGGSATGEETTP